MELARSMMIILLTGILMDNFVLSKFMGICPFLGVSKNPSGSLGMGLAVTFVMACATAVTYPLYYGFLVPMGLTYLNTILFILIIAVFVQLLEMFLKKFIPALYKSLGVYLPLITTNCAVLAVTLLNVSNGYTAMGGGLLLSCVNGFSAGVGFGLALILFCGVRKALEHAKPPKCFEGLPITLVAAALTSMTFMGFAGMADKLFG